MLVISKQELNLMLTLTLHCSDTTESPSITEIQVREQVRELWRSDIDWSRLFLAFVWHKVAFIVLERLKKLELLTLAVTEGNLPLLVLNHWKELHDANRKRVQVYLEELPNVAEEFERRGICYAVAKGGPLLIDRVYIAEERKMYDVDLLASSTDLRDIIDAMEALGYRQGIFDHDLNLLRPLPRDEYRRWLLHTRGLPNFLKLDSTRPTPLIFQVQFRIGSTEKSVSTDAVEFLKRRISFGSYHGVSDFDLLVQLALHIYRETTEQAFSDWGMAWALIKFCDFNRYVHWLLPQVDPALLVKHMAASGFAKQVLFAATYCNGVYPSTQLNQLIALIAECAGETPLAPDEVVVETHKKLARIGASGPDTSRWSQLMAAKTS